MFSIYYLLFIGVYVSFTYFAYPISSSPNYLFHSLNVLLSLSTRSVFVSSLSVRSFQFTLYIAYLIASLCISMSCTHFAILLGMFLHICLYRLLPLVHLLLSKVFFIVIVIININFIYLPRSVLSGHIHTHTHTHTRDLWHAFVHTFDISLLYF